VPASVDDPTESPSNGAAIGNQIIVTIGCGNNAIQSQTWPASVT
jgi:hypothetical protein